MSNEIDTLWLILATILVLSMQAGFLMLEGGRVRSKNSINVAQKNITDLLVVWAVFFSGGSLLMFGVSISALVDNAVATSEVLDQHVTPLHFIYQVAFCSTAATILSGAVAERFSFRAYMVLVAVIAGFIYPVVGRMVWGDLYNPDVNAWLADIGFIDFAGSTVVHGVGAWVGLVAIIMVGPRVGRFDKHGKPRVMAAHNAVIALFGVFVLIIGWLGFNGGSLSPSDPRLTAVLFNTITSAVFGGCAGMIVGAIVDKGVCNPTRVTSGLLGGLVACTAGVVYMSMHEAIIVGIAGGVTATYGSHLMLCRFKLDDPLDVVSTHGAAGVVGTLSVAFVMPVSAMVSQSRLTQLGVQGIGILVVGVFTVVATWLALTLIGRFMEIRVSSEAEQLGLNYTEHGESIGITRLQSALDKNLDDNTSFASGMSANSDDEHSEIAATLTKVINRYELASEQLLFAQKRFQQFAETASDWLWESDVNLCITFIHANSQDDRQTIQLDRLKGCNLLDTLHFEEAELEKFTAHLNRNERTPAMEAKLIIDDRSATFSHLEVRAVPSYDENNHLIGFRGTLTDISLQKAAEDKVTFLAMHDELTGLPNRRALSIDLASVIEHAKISNHTVVVAGMDLDGFKAVNDAYGHQIGDDLLVKVASRLKRFLRPFDRAYRTGGDEFIILFDKVGSRSAAVISESVTTRLIEQISKEYDVRDLQVRIGCSMGLSHFPQDHASADELLRMADLALYAAKDSGKGCVVSFEPNHDKEAEQQREMEQDLHRALRDDEFYLMYQPKIDTTTERVIGYEALIRWKHPQRGELSPAQFIPVAEKLKLMSNIGQYVLDSACGFAATWHSPLGEPLPTVSVNVSPQQFSNAGFFTMVMETLVRHKLDPKRLELEITEDMLINDFHAVSATLQQLCDAGVSIAIDDFGSGQTSLRYLNQFPLTTIKIDRSFISNLGSSEKTAEIIQTIILLAKRLGINVIAEGVEQNDQLALLKEWKCDQIQGFLFSRPMLSKDVTQWMHDQTASDRQSLG